MIKGISYQDSYSKSLELTNQYLKQESLSIQDTLILKMIKIRYIFLTQPSLAESAIQQLKTELKSLEKLTYRSIKDDPHYQEAWAYVCYIADLQKYPLKQQVIAKRIFAIGDSHILTLAYRPLWGCEVIPLLCIGIKAFHFSRPDLPQIKQFYSYINQYKEQNFLISIGEIDCRENEGIIKNLNQGRYTSLEEGVNSTFSIYEQALKDLDVNFAAMTVWPAASKRPLRAECIQKFNRKLQEQTSFKIMDGYQKVVHYQANKKDDFFEFGFLQSKYRLDGTHINPNVMHQLEKIDRIFIKNK